MKTQYILLILVLSFTLLLSSTIASADSTETLVIGNDENAAPPAATQPVLPTSQIDPWFPDKDPSTRTAVNGKRVFFSYKKQGTIIVKNNKATSAVVKINGQKIDIDNMLASNPNGTFTLDISRYTVTGENTLDVSLIQPSKAAIALCIQYPTLAVAKPGDVGMDEKKLQLVDTFINSEVNKGFPGAVLVVIKDGKIIKETAYGYQRKYADGGALMTAPQPMKTDTLFDIASNTKIFATTFAIMKLTSDGKINFNKPITTYLPNYKTWGREQRFVSDLLTHSAGYEPEILTYRPDNKYGLDAYSLTRKKTNKYIIEKAPLTYDRGTQTVYSDTDFMLLGALVEEVSGQTLDTYVENNIYKPLGLLKTMYIPLQKGIAKEQCAATEVFGNTRSGQVSFPEIRKNVLQGEVHDEKAWYSMQGISGSAGLFSTAHDLAVLCQVILNKGGYGNQKLFTKDIVDQFSKPSDNDITFGMGWRRQGNQDLKWHFGAYASHLAIGHTGWTGTCTVIDPQYNLAIILLTNKKHSLNKPETTDFYGDDYQTGQYGSIVQMVYDAMSDED